MARVWHQPTNKGVIVNVALENVEIIAMKKRNKEGNPEEIVQITTPPGTIVSEIRISRILPEDIDKIEKNKKKEEEEKKRTKRYRKLSPCCSKKMLHNDDDPEGIFSCTQCDAKYKKVSESWFRADEEEIKKMKEQEVKVQKKQE